MSSKRKRGDEKDAATKQKQRTETKRLLYFQKENGYALGVLGFLPFCYLFQVMAVVCKESRELVEYLTHRPTISFWQGMDAGVPIEHCHRLPLRYRPMIRRLYKANLDEWARYYGQPISPCDDRLDYSRSAVYRERFDQTTLSVLGSFANLRSLYIGLRGVEAMAYDVADTSLMQLEHLVVEVEWDNQIGKRAQYVIDTLCKRPRASLRHLHFTNWHLHWSSAEVVNGVLAWFEQLPECIKSLRLALWAVHDKVVDRWMECICGGAGKQRLWSRFPYREFVTLPMDVVLLS